jgi:hypothetical protein
MKNLFLASLAVLSIAQASAQNNPVRPNATSLLTEYGDTVVVAESITDVLSEHQSSTLLEIGLVFPVFSDGVRDFMTANAIQTNPLASGFGTGIQLGAHGKINSRATLGAILNATTFIASGDSLTQLYQTNLTVTGRAHVIQFENSSVFAEIGVGPEFAAYSLNNAKFKYQVSLASRFGVGYRHNFGNNLGLLASAVLSPDFGTTDPTRNLKIIIGMIW